MVMLAELGSFAIISDNASLTWEILEDLADLTDPPLRLPPACISWASLFSCTILAFCAAASALHCATATCASVWTS